MESYKIIIIGDTGTGKSSLLLKYTDNEFNDSFNSTIGADFRSKQIDIDNRKLKLMIWDTAGQERFRSITRSYYRTIDGIIITIDVTRRETFNNLQYWMNEVGRFEKSDCPIIIVGTKTDRNNMRQVMREDVELFMKIMCSKHNIEYMEASPKTDNVDAVFEKLGKKLADSNIFASRKIDSKTIDINDSPEKDSKYGLCCAIS